VFLIVTCVKLRWAVPILAYSPVGYKTKVVLALLASYVIGKISLSVIGLTNDSIEWLGDKIKSSKTSKTEEPLPANATALQSLLRLVTKLMNSGPWVTTFFGGLVGASILSNKSDLFYHYTASQAESSFHLNTGLLLILTSLIPGDGQFRLLEAVAGVILLAAGIRQTLKDHLLMAGSYGMVLNDYLKSQSPEKVVGTLAAIVKVLAALAKVPAGSEVPPHTSTPAENAAEVAAEPTQPTRATSEANGDGMSES
jgi:hypothetical protein